VCVEGALTIHKVLPAAAALAAFLYKRSRYRGSIRSTHA
jgi:hypothetical protein